MTPKQNPSYGTRDASIFPIDQSTSYRPATRLGLVCRLVRSREKHSCSADFQLEDCHLRCGCDSRAGIHDGLRPCCPERRAWTSSSRNRHPRCETTDCALRQSTGLALETRDTMPSEIDLLTRRGPRENGLPFTPFTSMTPRCDFSAESLLHNVGISDLGPHDGSPAREVLIRLDQAVTSAINLAQPITHYGIGTANVEKVASNRRILDEQGKVRATRYTTCRDPALRAEPDGVIDPQLTSLSFWNEEQAVAVLTYYACHPQSYYRTGVPSPDFPGIARFMRGQDLPDVLHVHFNGAAGTLVLGNTTTGTKRIV